MPTLEVFKQLSGIVGVLEKSPMTLLAIISLGALFLAAFALRVVLASLPTKKK